MNKIDAFSTDFINENIEKIEKLFPECVDIIIEGDNENKRVDVNKLLALLGADIELNEKYGFVWNGKYNSLKLAQIPSANTLVAKKEESVDWDNTHNYYIKGDNLEVLKILNKTFIGKIKCIYIDPPYNTGSDFIYEDDFSDSIKNYKDSTNQKQKANPETSGRFHTDWLNLMYPRLVCAKRLLSPDGVMFISMADTEIKNLLNICEEIFGKDNIEIFVWKKKSSAGNTEKILGVLTEYIVCCFNNKAKGTFNYNELERTYSFKDEKGPYNLEGIEKTNLGTYERPTMLYSIIDPQTGKEFKPGKDLRWTVGKDTLEKMIQDGKIFFDYKNMKVKRIKRPDDYEKSENVYYNLLLDYGSLSSAKDEIEQLLGSREIFDTPKPTQLIKHLLKIGSKKDSIILDFFSGSSTTAQAVIELNNEDGGNRSFIMVQIPEALSDESEGYKKGYKDICEIGIDRIRKFGNMNKNRDSNLFGTEADYGFKVFELDSSNIRAWDSSLKLDETSLLDQLETIKEDRKNLDVAYEIMLKYGVFDMPINEVVINNKTMYCVGKGFLIIDLNDDITLDDVECIGKEKPYCVIFKESGFGTNDNLKLNSVKTLETFGVQDIKCL